MVDSMKAPPHPAEEEVQFPTDDRGNGIGIGCLEDIAAAVQLCPGASFEHVVSWYHDDKAKPGFRDLFDRCRAHWRVLRRQEQESGNVMVNPSHFVKRKSEYSCLDLQSAVWLDDPRS